MTEENVVPIAEPPFDVPDIYEKLESVISALSHHAKDCDSGTVNGCILFLADIQRELAKGM